MSVVVRGGLVVIGFLLMLAGLAVITVAPVISLVAGLELVGFGAFLVVVVAFERRRYRSGSAELTNDPPGPGGGEPPGAELEARFRPTAELFIDPTTGRRMRVLVDPSSGERRYVAEG